MLSFLSNLRSQSSYSIKYMYLTIDLSIEYQSEGQTSLNI